MLISLYAYALIPNPHSNVAFCVCYVVASFYDENAIVHLSTFSSIFFFTFQPKSCRKIETGYRKCNGKKTLKCNFLERHFQVIFCSLKLFFLCVCGGHNQCATHVQRWKKNTKQIQKKKKQRINKCESKMQKTNNVMCNQIFVSFDITQHSC